MTKCLLFNTDTRMYYDNVNGITIPGDHIYLVLNEDEDCRKYPKRDDHARTCRVSISTQIRNKAHRVNGRGLNTDMVTPPPTCGELSTLTVSGAPSAAREPPPEPVRPTTEPPEQPPLLNCV